MTNTESTGPGPGLRPFRSNIALARSPGIFCTTQSMCSISLFLFISYIVLERYWDRVSSIGRYTGIGRYRYSRDTSLL